MVREVLFGPEMVLTFTVDGHNDFRNRGGEKKMRHYENVGDEVDQRTKNYMIIYGVGYAQAMQAILNADEELKAKYTGFDTATETYSEYPAGKQTQAEISAEVDRRVQILLKENRALSYSEAMIEVLQSDPELKEAYYGSYYKQVK